MPRSCRANCEYSDTIPTRKRLSHVGIWCPYTVRPYIYWSAVYPDVCKVFARKCRSKILHSPLHVCTWRELYCRRISVRNMRKLGRVAREIFRYCELRLPLSWLFIHDFFYLYKFARKKVIYLYKRRMISNDQISFLLAKRIIQLYKYIKTFSLYYRY